MLPCMNNNPTNNVSSVSSQTYNQQRPNNANMPLNNTMPHMPNNMTSLHHSTLRNQDISTTMQSNVNVNAMNNYNTSNVNSLHDFNFDFLDQQLTSNEFLNFNISDIM